MIPPDRGHIQAVTLLQRIPREAIVIDGSALVEALAGDAPADELLARVAENRLHIPHLLDHEFRNARRGVLLGGKIGEARAEGARTDRESPP